MVDYPDGAGPSGARFTGEVYTPPGATSDSSGSRPEYASLAAVTESDGIKRARFLAPTWTYWLVHRITVQSDTHGNAYIYVGNETTIPTVDQRVSGTFSGAFDENEALTPYLVPEGMAMIVEWPSGGVCWARIEYYKGGRG